MSTENLGTSGPQDISSDRISAFDAQVAAMEDIAKYSSDLCHIATYIALSDATLKSKLQERLTNPLLEFVTLDCSGPDALYNMRLLFKFRYELPYINLVDPSVLAIVNMETREVRVQDPYIPMTSLMCGCQDKDTSLTDPLDAIKNLVGSVLGSEVSCNAMSGPGDCNSTERCRRAFRFLKDFRGNPNRDTVQGLSNYVNGSDRNKKCMRRIFEVQDADFSAFVAAIAEYLG